MVGLRDKMRPDSRICEGPCVNGLHLRPGHADATRTRRHSNARRRAHQQPGGRGAESEEGEGS